MSFGISAAAWVAIGVVAAGATYSTVKSNQAANAARSQAKQALDLNAQDTAQAQSDAANEANALALGGTDDTLGGGPMGTPGTGNALSYGQTAAVPSYGGSSSSTLGGGTPVTSVGGRSGGSSGGGQTRYALRPF